MMKKKHVGIDIAKNVFDLHILEDGKDIHYEYTDKIDARSNAALGTALHPPAAEQVSENARKQRSLVARRHQLISIRVAENNRMEHAYDKFMARSIKAVTATLKRQIANFDKEIHDQVQQQPELKQKTDILKSMPGIGETAAFMLFVGG